MTRAETMIRLRTWVVTTWQWRLNLRNTKRRRSIHTKNSKNRLLVQIGLLFTALLLLQPDQVDSYGLYNTPATTCTTSTTRAGLLRKGFSGFVTAAVVSASAPSRARAALDAEALKGLQTLQTYYDDDGIFRVTYPLKWTTSPRKSKLPLTEGVQGRTGTVLVVGDFKESISVSVTLSNMRSLLRGAGVDGSGRMDRISDIGQASGVSNLLLMQRDGSLEEKNPLSRVAEAKITRDNEVEFVAEAIVKLMRTGTSPTADTIPYAPNLRKTLAKSILYNNGSMVTCWASADEAKWNDDVESTLRAVLDSFELQTGSN